MLPGGQAANTRLPLEGHAALARFALDPRILHLNHGSFGAAPHSVLEEQQRWRMRMEGNPMRFFLDELPLLLRERAAGAARCFGGDAEGWVFVENATAAANAVLKSLPLRETDVLVTTSHAYGAVLKTVQRRASETGASLRIAEIRAPVTGEDEIVEAIARALCPRTRLLVVDHVTSQTAAALPIARIISLAHERNVPVLVDGAHAVGMLAVDVASMQADWYTGNAHKWMFAPKGCALLWTAPVLRASTHAHVTSHGWGAGYLAEFDWVGTRDPSPWLCFDAAVQAHDWFGGQSLMARNNALALQAGDYLEKRLKAPRAARGSLQSAMTSLRLAPKATVEQTIELRRALETQYGIEAPFFPFQGELWLRASAQIYNEMDDYVRLAAAVEALLSSG
ncbi:MAG: aminotransferase class V-fold PLP-dependent enzyme [Alphaproteobacteria bacterium]